MIYFFQMFLLNPLVLQCTWKYHWNRLDYYDSRSVLLKPDYLTASFLLCFCSETAAAQIRCTAIEVQRSGEKVWAVISRCSQPCQIGCLAHLLQTAFPAQSDVSLKIPSPSVREKPSYFPYALLQLQATTEQSSRLQLVPFFSTTLCQ